MKSARWQSFRSLSGCVLLSRPTCAAKWRNAGPHGTWPARICELHDEICAGSGGLCNTPVEVISRAVPPSQEDPLGAFNPTSREGDGPGFMEHYLWRHVVNQ